MNLPGALGEVDVKAATRAIAATRIGLGGSFLLAPGLALRLWPGRRASTEEDRAMACLLARSVGARDVALGLGTLLALSHDAPVRGWVEAGMLADAGDALAIGLAFRRLPRAQGILMFLASLGTAVAGRRLAGSVG